MKTKVSNCGQYKCTHCGSQGHCLLTSISIDKDGKCILFKSNEKFTTALSSYSDPIDEHTNMC